MSHVHQVTVVITRPDGLRQWDLLERASHADAHEHHDVWGGNFEHRRAVEAPTTSAWWWSL